jgi:hypothetical protein
MRRSIQMVYLGVDIIDIGGEFTKPGAIPVDEQTELEPPKLRSIYKIIITQSIAHGNHYFANPTPLAVVTKHFIKSARNLASSRSRPIKTNSFLRSSLTRHSRSGLPSNNICTP